VATFPIDASIHSSAALATILNQLSTKDADAADRGGHRKAAGAVTQIK